MGISKYDGIGITLEWQALVAMPETCSFGLGVEDFRFKRES